MKSRTLRLVIIFEILMMIAIVQLILHQEKTKANTSDPPRITTLDVIKDYRRVIIPPQPEPEPVPVKILKGFEVTWYNIQGTTALGTQTVPGRTVGVDPTLIPLGTWIEIHMPDGRILKRRAEDTGEAVKGRVLDVYASRSNSELLDRGRSRDVTVHILGGE